MRDEACVNRILLLLIVVALAVLGIAIILYNSRSGNHLNVTPEVEREIEKAKHR